MVKTKGFSISLKIIFWTSGVLGICLFFLGVILQNNLSEVGTVLNQSFKAIESLLNSNFEEIGTSVKKNLNTNFEDFLKKIGEIQAKNMANNCEYWLLVKDKGKLTTICQSIVQDENVAYALIEDKDKNVVSMKSRSDDYKPRFESNPEHIAAIEAKSLTSGTSFILPSGKKVMEFACPIFTITAQEGEEGLFGEEAEFEEDTQKAMVTEKIGFVRVGLNFDITSNEIRKNEEILKKLFANAKDQSNQLFNKTKSESEAKFKDTTIMFATLATFFMFALTAILFVVIRYILSPLGNLVEMAKRIAQGDLSKQIEVNSADEVGELAGAFNRMISNLQKLLLKIREASLQITSASHQIRASSDEQATGAAEQSSSVAETTTTVEELANTASQIAENTKSVVAVADTSSKKAREGEQLMADALNGIEEAKEKVGV